MEKRTKKGLLIGSITLTVGLGLFALGIVCSTSIIGLIGFVLTADGGFQTIVYTIKGISEIISFNKMWREHYSKSETGKGKVEEYENEKKSFMKLKSKEQDRPTAKYFSQSEDDRSSNNEIDRE